MPDNAGKASKKKLRVRGRIQRNAEGRALYATGDCARLSLHQQTFYGAIKQDDEIRYVVRKPLDSLEKKDIEKIVDPEVRQKVKEAVDAKGMKDAVADGIWMNEEKRIPIKKVRIYTSIANPLRLKRNEICRCMTTNEIIMLPMMVIIVWEFMREPMQRAKRRRRLR